MLYIYNIYMYIYIYIYIYVCVYVWVIVCDYVFILNYECVWIWNYGTMELWSDFIIFYIFAKIIADTHIAELFSQQYWENNSINSFEETRILVYSFVWLIMLRVCDDLRFFVNFFIFLSILQLKNCFEIII